jgi:hypothetical protein
MLSFVGQEHRHVVPGHEADHSSPTSAKVKIKWILAEVVVALEVTATGSNDAVLNEVG